MKELLRDYPVNLFEANDVEEAERHLREFPFDLIISDVIIHEKYTFELLRHMPPRARIVIWTSTPDHAATAYDIGAVDYLVKPADEQRIACALQKTGMPLHMGREEVRATDYITIPYQREIRKILIRDLVFLKADSNYTYLYTADGQIYYVYRTLAEWETILGSRNFLRITRSFIIGLTHVQKIHHTNRTCCHMVLSGIDEPVRLGRRAIERLQNHAGAYGKRVLSR